MRALLRERAVLSSIDTAIGESIPASLIFLTGSGERESQTAPTARRARDEGLTEAEVRDVEVRDVDVVEPTLNPVYTAPSREVAEVALGGVGRDCRVVRAPGGRGGGARSVG
jgi:hypothetical protein